MLRHIWWFVLILCNPFYKTDFFSKNFLNDYFLVKLEIKSVKFHFYHKASVHGKLIFKGALTLPRGQPVTTENYLLKHEQSSAPELWVRDNWGKCGFFPSLFLITLVLGRYTKSSHIAIQASDTLPWDWFHFRVNSSFTFALSPHPSCFLLLFCLFVCF